MDELFSERSGRNSNGPGAEDISLMMLGMMQRPYLSGAQASVMPWRVTTS